MSNVADTVAVALPSVEGPLLAAPHRLGEELPPLPCERYDWTSMAFKIMLSGAAYPSVLILLFISLATVESLPQYWVRGVDAEALGRLVLSALMLLVYGVLLGGFIGFVWAGVVSLFVLPLTYMLAKSLRVAVGFTLLSAVCGGMVGFVAAMPSIPLVTDGRHWEWQGLVWVLAVGPGLTTVLGQIGGALGGRREELLSRAVQPLDEYAPTSRRPLQFGMRQLLWTSVWLSLLLAAIKLSGVHMEVIVPLLAGWLVYQAATLYIGWILAARAWPRWRAWRTAGRSM